MDEIFKWAKENGFHKVIAGITKGNTRALKFYINYGFSMTNELTTHDGGLYLVKEVK
jgi:hypothetical protein